MVLASPEAVPPIVAPVPTQRSRCHCPPCAAELVPIRFPTTVHDGASIQIPGPTLPEMVLASPEAVPPIVAPVPSTKIPSSLGMILGPLPTLIPSQQPATSSPVLPLRMPTSALGNPLDRQALDHGTLMPAGTRALGIAKQ